MAESRFHRRSKEHLLARTSSSVFLTNFPDQIFSKDLWQSCSQYGTVSDVYIPAARSKTGKRFAFVRFLKPDNLDLIVANQCTIWHGKLRLHANISKFPRNVKAPVNVHGRISGDNRVNHVEPLRTANISNGMSFSATVRGVKNPLDVRNDENSMVLDDSCLNLNDQSFTLVGKVKEFGSLLKLADVLSKEGFQDVVIRYMGGFWASFEFKNAKLKENFNKHKGVASWFSVILPWTKTFVVDSRVIWIDIEGLPSVAWTPFSFEKIANRWGDLLYAEDQNDTNLYRKRLCINTLSTNIIMETFKVIVQGKVFHIRAREVIGWNPEFVEEEEEDDEEENDSISSAFKDLEIEDEREDGELKENTAPLCPNVASPASHSVTNNLSHSAATASWPPGFTPPRPAVVGVSQSNSSPEQIQAHIPTVPSSILAPNPPRAVEQVSSAVNSVQPDRISEEGFIGGRRSSVTPVVQAAESMGDSKQDHETVVTVHSESFLKKLDDFVLLGQTMGYNMEGCLKNVEEIINHHGRSCFSI
ncbi:hypothetical protein LXL04_023741 [Taraxacum kok-saghyz]